VEADGGYPKAPPKEDSGAVLVLVGLDRKGEEEILALEEGYRKSAQSWRGSLRNIGKRGVAWVVMLIADGALRLRNAQRNIFSRPKGQRCWVPKMRNTADKILDGDYSEVSAGFFNSAIASTTVAHILADPNETHSPITRGSQLFSSRISGSVIHDDKLKI